MSLNLTPIPLVQGVSTTIPVTSVSNLVAVVIANESPYAVALQGPNNNAWLPAWYENIFDMTGALGPLVMTPYLISNSSDAPSATALVTLYVLGDTIPQGAWPVALSRQTNIGNSGAVGSVSTVQNDGNAPPTIFIESTPSGQATSSIAIANDGSLIVRTLDGSVWTDTLQIIPGNAGLTVIQLGSNLVTDATNFGLNTQRITFQREAASTVALSAIGGFFSTTGIPGPGNFMIVSHGCTNKPDIIVVTSAKTSGTPGAFSAYDITATQVKIAGPISEPWQAICYRYSGY